MLNCFKKDYRKPSKEHGSHGEGETLKVNWGYIVPHHQGAQGATTYDKKWSEYQYGVSVAALLSIPWDDRNNGGVKSATKRLVAKKVTATWEDHKNAYKYPTVKAEGAEILVIKGDELSRHHAELILDAFKERFPARKIRGVKEMKKGGRGYNNLLLAKKGGADIALLGEMFFIDNPKDYIDPKTYADFLKSVLV